MVLTSLKIPAELWAHLAEILPSPRFLLVLIPRMDWYTTSSRAKRCSCTVYSVCVIHSVPWGSAGFTDYPSRYGAVQESAYLTQESSSDLGTRIIGTRWPSQSVAEAGTLALVLDYGRAIAVVSIQITTRSPMPAIYFDGGTWKLLRS